MLTNIAIYILYFVIGAVACGVVWCFVRIRRMCDAQLKDQYMFNLMPQFGTLVATLSIAFLAHQSNSIAQQAFAVAMEARAKEAQSFVYMANIDREWKLRIHEHHNREFRPTAVTLIPIYRVEGRPHMRGQEIPVPITDVKYLQPTERGELHTFYVSNTKRFLCPDYQVSEAARKKCDQLVDVRIIITTVDGTKPAVLTR